MKPITPQLSHTAGIPIYMQLYHYLKDEITCGTMTAGEKLPSLRRLSQELGISLTTTEAAYNQLLVEGYIVSRPQSGYYVAAIAGISGQGDAAALPDVYDLSSYTFQESDYLYDSASFDFGKWKKCMSKVLTDYAHMLLSESDPQGEAALRFEISKYVYSSRGVRATPDQIIIGAGTQQLTAHLCRVLKRMGINQVATEEPGYLPAQSSFRDHGFVITPIHVASDGISIERLPQAMASAVYVSPSNQFPTGSVMPIGRRYQLLTWAKETGSFILEDDYDSELRYFGKPVPALQGLDNSDRVVYLGSFSSTLFPAIKISYMVLPQPLLRIWQTMKSDYTQTCSKTEQLTLALFMEHGLYYRNIKKLRGLYAQKLQTAMTAFAQYADDFVTPINTNSGIHILLKLRTKKDAAELSAAAKSVGLLVLPAAALTDQDTTALIFYYNQIPLDRLDDCIGQVCRLWRG